MKDDAALPSSDMKLEAVLYALSDPVRLHIVRNLAARGELPCFAAVTGLDIAKSTQSHHYRILREAGVIAQRKEGVCFLSSLRRDELNKRFPGLLDAILRNAGEFEPAPVAHPQCEPAGVELCTASITST
jgi:DNA-binding transcriptional ArsR family regulator